MRNRKEVLEDLVELRGDFADVLKELHRFPWDVDEVLYTISKRHLEKALSMFNKETLSEEQIEAWADSLEVREDLDFDSEETKEIVHQLANPLLFPMSLAERQEKLLDLLRS